MCRHVVAQLVGQCPDDDPHVLIFYLGYTTQARLGLPKQCTAVSDDGHIFLVVHATSQLGVLFLCLKQVVRHANCTGDQRIIQFQLGRCTLRHSRHIVQNGARFLLQSYRRCT